MFLREFSQKLVTVPGLYGEKKDKFDSLGELISSLYESHTLFKKSAEVQFIELKQDLKSAETRLSEGVAEAIKRVEETF